LANSFKGKRKISGYLTTDNTKFESLNWNENQNYGGNTNMTTEVTDDGGIMMWGSGDEFSWGTGFPVQLRVDYILVINGIKTNTIPIIPISTINWMLVVSILIKPKIFYLVPI
jgi:hypothetical protein